MNTAATKFRVGAWTVTPALNLLERDSHAVKLESRAMDVLTALAAQPGAVLSVDDFMAAVWQGVVVSDSSVYLAISQLRQALDSAGTSHIETIPKRGYRLTMPVESVEPVSAPAGAPFAVPSVAPTTPPARGSRRKWIAAALGIACIAIVFWLWPRSTGGSAHSVAVLPFENLSSDLDQQYFADGITAEVLSLLSSIHDLRVIGRASSFQLAARADSRQAGRLLGVRYVLAGTVRRSADQVRITAQLSDTETGDQVWSQTYERRLDDIFAIQDEIARSVANALQIKLGVGEAGRVPGMTRDVAAYDEYLRGMELNLEARPESYPAAIAHLQRAVSLDPAFSVAWAGLHGTCANGGFAVPDRAEEWRLKGAAALAQARALTPDAPHVLLELGIDQVRGGQWLAGAATYRQLDESYQRHGMADMAWAPRGIFLLAVGRARESVPVIEQARAREPLAPALAGFLSAANLVNSNYREALAEVDRGLTLKGLRKYLLTQGVNIALNQGDRPEIERRLSALRADGATDPNYLRLGELLDDREGAVRHIRARARWPETERKPRCCSGPPTLENRSSRSIC